jgi:hypothetical protein
MAKRLAAADEQADYQADTSGDADGFPWIFEDISVGSLRCLFGFDKQCHLRLRHLGFHNPEGFFRRGVCFGQFLTTLIGSGFQQRFRIYFYFRAKSRIIPAAIAPTPTQTGTLTVSLSLTDSSIGPSLMRLLGVGETAIRQPQAAGHDQRDCQHLDCVHLIFSGSDTFVLATGKPGKTETVNNRIALPDHLAA